MDGMNNRIIKKGRNIMYHHTRTVHLHGNATIRTVPAGTHVAPRHGVYVVAMRPDENLRILRTGRHHHHHGFRPSSNMVVMPPTPVPSYIAEPVAAPVAVAAPVPAVARPREETGWFRSLSPLLQGVVAIGGFLLAALVIWVVVSVIIAVVSALIQVVVWGIVIFVIIGVLSAFCG